jgi:hypothetical protein
MSLVAVTASETVGMMGAGAGAGTGAGIGVAALAIPSITALTSWAKSIEST